MVRSVSVLIRNIFLVDRGHVARLSHPVILASRPSNKGLSAMFRSESICIRVLGRITCIVLFLSWHNGLLAQGKVWSLNECINRALDENVYLNQQVANNEVNRINYDQSRANRLPTLNFSDGYSLNYGRNINPITNLYTNQDVRTNNSSLSSSVTLFNGLKNINLIKENKLNYEAGNLDIEKARNTLMLNVVAAYMQVLFEYEAIAVANAQIAATSEHLNYTERYVRAGALPESNLLQMRAQLAGDKAAEVDAESQLQLAKVGLMQLMELPVDPDFEIERPEQKELLADVVAPPGEVYNAALTFLPEIKSAAVRTRAAEAGLKVARGGALPRLTLSGSLGTAYSSGNKLVSYQAVTTTEHLGYLASDPTVIVDGPVNRTITNSSQYPFFRQVNDNFGQGISLNLSVPLANNRVYRSEIRRNEVAVRVARLNETIVKNQVRKSIESACVDQRSAGKNYVAAKEQLAAAEQSYNNVTIKFRAGIINTTDYFVEKSNYIKAQQACLQAKYQYLYKAKIVNFYLNNSIDSPR